MAFNFSTGTEEGQRRLRREDILDPYATAGEIYNQTMNPYRQHELELARRAGEQNVAAVQRQGDIVSGAIKDTVKGTMDAYNAGKERNLKERQFAEESKVRGENLRGLKAQNDLQEQYAPQKAALDIRNMEQQAEENQVQLSQKKIEQDRLNMDASQLGIPGAQKGETVGQFNFRTGQILSAAKAKGDMATASNAETAIKLANEKSRSDAAKNYADAEQSRAMAKAAGNKPPKEEKAPTEAEGKAALAVTKMENAEKTIEELYAKGFTGTSGKQAADVAASGNSLTRGFSSADAQKLRQAQIDWVQAKVRYESGANIPESEAIKEAGIYFPGFNEDEASIIAKKQARDVFMAGTRSIAGKHAPKQMLAGGKEEMDPIVAEMQRRERIRQTGAR